MKKKLIGLLALLIIMLSFVSHTNEVRADEFVKTFKVTAKKFGAKKGTDSTEAIQKALDAATKAGTKKKQAKVFIPKGTYYISSELVIGSNTYLELAEGAVIKKSPDVRNNTFYMLHTKTGEKGKYADNINITIDGGVWDAEFKTYTASSGGSLFVLAHSKNVVIKNVTLCNNFGTHLIELDGVKNCTISYCKFYGFKASNKDTEKEAIQLDICHDDVIAPGAAPFDDTPCSEITISNNEIFNYPRAFGSHTMVEGIYHKDITLVANNIHDISAAAIYGYNYANVIINNNKFDNVGCGIQIKSYSEKSKNTVLPRLKGVKAMTLSDNNFNIIIKENDILTSNVPANEVSNDGGSMGIFIYGTADYPVNNVEIEHNRLLTDSSGVYLRYVKHATIKNNTFDRHDTGYDVEKSVFAEDAIKLANTEDVRITENRISSMSSSSYENGIAMRDGCKEIFSEQNQLYNMTKSGIAVYAGCEYIGNDENISNVGKHGLTVDGGLATVSGFVISNCGENGVTLKNGSILSMSDSSISANIGKGISIMGKQDDDVLIKSEVELRENTIFDNGDTGVYVNNSIIQMDDCQVMNNAGKGVNVVNESEINMQNTVIMNSGSNGFKSDSCLVEAQNNRIINNCVSEKDGKAVFMMAGTSGYFTNNVIYNPDTKYEIYMVVGVKFKPTLVSQKTEVIRGKKDESGNIYDVE